jgi:hypothetical protein
VLKVTKDIRLSMEDGQVTVLLLLDFSQAFNMVVHGLLLCKLRNARAQFVISGAEESFFGAMIPQGSALGPLLFISYIDDDSSQV